MPSLALLPASDTTRRPGDIRAQLEEEEDVVHWSQADPELGGRRETMITFSREIEINGKEMDASCETDSNRKIGRKGASFSVRKGQHNWNRFT